jgi:hypothetical protein
MSQLQIVYKVDLVKDLPRLLVKVNQVQSDEVQSGIVS